jgi:hypothetical protein
MFKFIVLALVLGIGGLISWQLEEHVHSTRWAVKTLADGFQPDTAVRSSTITEQSRMTALQTDEDMPRCTSERTVYRIEANLIELKKEVDNDYHLVLEDPRTHQRIIAEIPDGSDSPAKYASQFRKARRQIDRVAGEPGFFAHHVEPSVPVVVTGLGFFDEPHIIPQIGMASNCREIHPVLTVEMK